MVYKSLAKAVLGLILVFMVIAASFFLYFRATYLNEVVTSGSGYGFTIGSSKDETYKKVPAAFFKLSGKDPRIFMEIEVDKGAEQLLGVKSGYRVMVETYLHNVGFQKFASQQQWEFYFEGLYRDSITLTFCGDNLCRIYRHRQYFELP